MIGDEDRVEAELLGGAGARNDRVAGRLRPHVADRDSILHRSILHPRPSAFDRHAPGGTGVLAVAI
jgi:hypothetical protein